MGFIKSSLFISLDGVTESPDSWHFPYFDDAMGEIVGGLMADNDANLFGRTTYEEFAGYWPTADPDDAITKQMNETKKYVVSTTLSEATWQNTEIVSTDLVATLTDLKKNLRLNTAGSSTLVQWLIEEKLLDELHLLVHPIVVGHGKKLFTEGATVPLQLASSKALDSGVVHLVYAPAA